jgi:hypothetical protein
MPENEGAQISIQMGVGDATAMLNARLTRIMNQAGQGGDFQVRGDEFEVIDFNRVYEIKKAGPQHFEALMKQECFEVWENETWMQVSERLAASYQMPKLSIFKIVPVDGENTPISSSSGEEDTYIFDWKPWKQYWWTNEYDPARDRKTGPG